MPSLWTKCNIQQPEVCTDAPNIAHILAKKGNLDACNYKCSLRQSHYVFCKNLGEEYGKLHRECDYGDVLHNCGFDVDKEEFCITMDDPTSYVETISDECFSEESNVTDGVCSTNCRNVLVEFIDTFGCCVNFFSGIFFDIESTAQVVFSACGIEIPDVCNSFNSTAVPDDFLECAGRTINNKVTTTNNNKVNNTINTSGAALQSGVYSIGLIIIGLIGTYI